MAKRLSAAGRRVQVGARRFIFSLFYYPLHGIVFCIKLSIKTFLLSFTLLFILLTHMVQSKIQKAGWIRFDDCCYTLRSFINVNGMTKPGAEALCALLEDGHARLAAVHSEDEQAFIMETFGAAVTTSVGANHKTAGVWLGAQRSDSLDDNDISFAWEDDFSTVDKANVATNATAFSALRCLSLDLSSGKWTPERLVGQKCKSLSA